MEDVLLYLSCFYDGDWQKIYDAVKNVQPMDKIKLKEYKKRLTSNYITILDVGYPEYLKSISRPPYVLYYQGDLSLISNINNNIAVIGTRNNSIYGEKCTKNIVIDLLMHDYTIVSGLAKGIDSIAHKTCLDYDGKTIAVIGCGLDYVYPKENFELQKNIINKGLIISEYPDFVKPKAEHYPLRNRIIAAISKGLLVTEAKYKSGTMITVRYGLEFGKDIFCVPYPINSQSGCNALIKQGAMLIENAKDIIEQIK